MTEPAKGILAMVVACLVWGAAPLYYKLLVGIPTIEILAHRTIWSCVTFAAILAVQGRMGQIRVALASPKSRGTIAIAAFVISLNWFLFIYSIQIDKAVEASLGYYIFPLVAVLIDWLGFGEKLLRAQWLAVGLHYA